VKKSKLSFFLHSSMNIFYTPDATLPRRTVLAMKRKKLLAIANDTFTPTSEIQKTTASNFIVTKHEGDWYALALQRASDKQPEPNHWGLPGGGVEPDETLLEGAIRETAEEAGLRPDPRFILPVALVSAPTVHKQYLYTMTYVRDFFEPDLDSDPFHEHQAYRWVKFKDWPDPPHTRVKNLIDSIGKKKLHHLADELKNESDRIERNVERATRRAVSGEETETDMETIAEPA
jgi:8-oxo-dGTP pyrophosphatase MutT (NUDIX family)